MCGKLGNKGARGTGANERANKESDRISAQVRNNLTHATHAAAHSVATSSGGTITVSTWQTDERASCGSSSSALPAHYYGEARKRDRERGVAEQDEGRKWESVCGRGRDKTEIFNYIFFIFLYDLVFTEIPLFHHLDKPGIMGKVCMCVCVAEKLQ